MADNDVIGGLDNLIDTVSDETPTYTVKDPNTDMVKAINKCIDAATGETGTEYEYKDPNTDVIQKMEELATAIASSGGGGKEYADLTQFAFYFRRNTLEPTITKIDSSEVSITFRDNNDTGYELSSYSVPLEAGIYVAEIYVTVDKVGGDLPYYTWGIYSTYDSDWARANGDSMAINIGVTTYVPFVTSDTLEHYYEIPIKMMSDGTGYICFAMAADKGVNATVTVRSLKIRKA